MDGSRNKYGMTDIDCIRGISKITVRQIGVASTCDEGFLKIKRSIMLYPCSLLLYRVFGS